MPDRRSLLKATAATGLATFGVPAFAQSFAYQANQRYPDPAVQIAKAASSPANTR